MRNIFIFTTALLLLLTAEISGAQEKKNKSKSQVEKPTSTAKATEKAKEEVQNESSSKEKSVEAPAPTSELAPMPTPATGSAQTPAVGLAPSPTPSLDPRTYPGLNIMFNGGSSMMWSEVAGTGMSAKSPKTLGTNYGGKMSYGLSENPITLFASYQNYTVKHQDASGVTPNAFEQIHTRTEVGFLLREKVNPTEAYYSFGLGYYYENRETTRITPVVSAGAQLSGPMLLLGLTHGYGAKTFGELDFSLGFPNAFREINTITGQYSFGLSSVLSYKFIYQYTDDLDFGLGVIGKYDITKFSGTSTGTSGRGVSDATENFTNITVPIELRIKF